MDKRAINHKALTDVRNFVEGSKSFIQAVHKEALREVAWRLIKYSPVGDPTLWHPPYWPKGYNPGHFKANWQVGRDSKPIGIIPGEDARGDKTLMKMYSMGRWTVGHVYYFTNNVPYAYVLEMGLHSSQVGPQGMVGRVRREWRQIVMQAAQDVKHTGKWKTGGD